jgi:RNA polymerase sigma-32 factor
MRSEVNESTSLSRYVAYASRVPRLTREREHELAVRVRDHGDAEAEEALVRANLRYVVSIALGYRHYGIRVADLIAEGNVGLVTALRKFDPERGTRFVTYAAHWIRAFVLDHVLRAWSIVGVGSGPLRSKLFFRLRREKARLGATHDPSRVDDLLALQFGTTRDNIAVLAQRLESRDLSLDAPVRADAAGSVLDTVASPTPSQEDQFFAGERASQLGTQVRAALEVLDPRERYIMETRVMADLADELSLAEIGRRLGVSRERARQIEVRAKQKLRRALGEESPNPPPPTIDESQAA